jgi:hypothetical protein
VSVPLAVSRSPALSSLASITARWLAESRRAIAKPTVSEEGCTHRCDGEIEEWPAIRMMVKASAPACPSRIHAVCLNEYSTNSGGSLSLRRIPLCWRARELGRYGFPGIACEHKTGAGLVPALFQHSPYAGCHSRIAAGLHLLDGPRGEVHSNTRNSGRLLHACAVSRRQAARPGS